MKDHIALTLTSCWAQGSDRGISGSGASLGLLPAPGARLGLIYTINFGQRLGMETGAYLGGQTIGYQVDAGNASDFPLNGLRTRDLHAFMELPFRIFGRFKVSDRLYSYSMLGAKVTRFRQFQGGINVYDEQEQLAMEFRYTTNPDYGMYLFWDLGSGILWQMKNEDMLRLNITWNPIALSPGAALATGEYAYYDPQGGNLLKRGAFQWRGSYLGLEIGYVFTRTRELARNLGE